MKRIIIDLEDDYTTGVSITAMGVTDEVKSATRCFNNIRNNTHIIMHKSTDNSINWTQQDFIPAGELPITQM